MLSFSQRPPRLRIKCEKKQKTLSAVNSLNNLVRRRLLISEALRGPLTL